MFKSLLRRVAKIKDHKGLISSGIIIVASLLFIFAFGSNRNGRTENVANKINIVRISSSLDVETILQQANQASDLTYIGDTSRDGEVLRKHRYTDPDGGTVFFWMDHSDTVAMYERHDSSDFAKNVTTNDGWTLYKNTCGYSIEYPNNWKRYEYHDIIDNNPCPNIQLHPRQIAEDPDGLQVVPSGIRIYIYNKSLESTLENMARKERAEVFDFNGIRAIEVPADTEQDLNYLLEKDGLTIQITYSANEYHSNLFDFTPDEVQKILSTFKLTE